MLHHWYIQVAPSVDVCVRHLQRVLIGNTPALGAKLVAALVLVLVVHRHRHPLRLRLHQKKAMVVLVLPTVNVLLMFVPV